MNLLDNHGWTALTIASQFGHVEVVRLLLEAGADMNLVDNHGWTALTIASSNCQVGVVRLLLEAGADFNLANNRGFTALTTHLGKIMPKLCTCCRSQWFECAKPTELICSPWLGRG